MTVETRHGKSSDLPYISEEKGGNKLIGNGNAITLDKAGVQYKEGEGV